MDKRYKGEFPVIGIRPTIDARKGVLDVRGSLEEQTMGMANKVKALLESKLKYSDGSTVKVIVAKSTIGRVAETAECAEYFKREGVDITISVTPCWCYGSETMDMDPSTIKAVWGYSGTERPGAVYLAAVLAAHAQKGLPAFGIYGKDVQLQEDQFLKMYVKNLTFCTCSCCLCFYEGKSYLQIGSLCMVLLVFYQHRLYRRLSWNES